jgi:hypothetical protein
MEQRLLEAIGGRAGVRIDIPSKQENMEADKVITDSSRVFTRFCKNTVPRCLTMQVR